MRKKLEERSKVYKLDKFIDKYYYFDFYKCFKNI